jgi:hypothetical protein
MQYLQSALDTAANQESTNMTETKLNSLRAEMQRCLEAIYDAGANGMSCQEHEEIYDYAAELEEAGIGGVVLDTSRGNPRWFSLYDMAF